jgi:hypothetical protein
MATTMKLIGKQTLTGNATDVTFSDIPGTGYTDLYLVFSARQDSNDGSASPTFMRFNGNSANYSNRELEAQGSVASYTNLYNVTSASFVAQTPSASQTSNTFGNCEIYIPNYAGSTNKSFSVTGVSENNASTSLTWYVQVLAGLWSNTAAITSITIYAGNIGVRNFVSGSSFFLYGITKA